MTTALNPNNSASALAYWNLIKEASTSVKLELISMMSRSLIQKVPQQTASDFYGILPDDSQYTTEEWLEDIREGRNGKNRDIDLFV